MNPTAESERRTCVIPERMPPTKAPFNAAAFFAGKDRLARLGMLVALVALVVAGLAVTLALSSARQKVLFVVLDPAGNVIQVATTGKELIASVDPVGDHTPTLGRKKSFFDELFGNIGTISQPGLPGGSPQQ